MDYGLFHGLFSLSPTAHCNGVPKSYEKPEEKRFLQKKYLSGPHWVQAEMDLFWVLDEMTRDFNISLHNRDKCTFYLLIHEYNIYLFKTIGMYLFIIHYLFIYLNILFIVVFYCFRYHMLYTHYVCHL